jgi:cation diffusion facilitator family transporter
MKTHPLVRWQHNHEFNRVNKKGEARTALIMVITIIAMAVEIITGSIFGSMALLADGWHMGTHAAAFAITIFAYRYARNHSTDSRFSFGTGKVSILGGYTSAIALAVIALLIGVESVVRLVRPREIFFNEAIAVALLGLLVNLFCAYLLHGHHTHTVSDRSGHTHHHDHNLRGAYLHVLADALTSVLAIFALSFGKLFGWHWLDPIMGIVGALVITRWSYGLMKDTSAILLDRNIDEGRLKLIRQKIEEGADAGISDLHVWKVGPVDYAAVISVVARSAGPAEEYKRLLEEFDELSHVTVEVNIWEEGPGGEEMLG